MININHFSAIFILYVLATNVFAADKVLDASQIDKDPVSLAQYFAVLEDPSTALTIMDVQTSDVANRFKGDQAPSEALNFSYSSSAYWLRLTLHNPSNHTVERMLEIGHALLSDVSFYLPTKAGEYQSVNTGNLTPFASRPYKNRVFVFPVSLPAQSTQVFYFRIRSTVSIVVPATLWEPNAFRAHERNDYVGQALYFGLTTGMILFNLLLFVALRDVIHLFYVGSVACAAAVLAERSGLAKEFLSIDSVMWSNISASVVQVLAGATLLLFMRRMLDTAKLFPRLDNLVKVLVGVQFFLLAGFVISFETFVKPASAVYLLAAILVIGTCVQACLMRQRSAYFFTAAFALLVIGSAMNVFRAAGLLPTNIFTVNGYQVGSALEMVLLAFALADRFNEIRRENARVQQVAIGAQEEALQAQKEKMTSLTQLVTNVAHEINTPIGAVKSSGQNIAGSLDLALTSLPRLFQILEPKPHGLFIQLLGQARGPMVVMTTREERLIKKQVKKQLEEAGVEGADWKARILVELRAQSAPLEYLPLLQHPESNFILETASTIGVILNSMHVIDAAVNRVSKIVTTLRSFSNADRVSEMTDADIKTGIEAVLTIYSNQIKQGTELVRHFEDIRSLRCLPDQLIQVWTHLIHNALQAMDGKGKLTVALKQVGNEAVVSVTDTGSGIPDAVRGRIFEPFFSTRPDGEGAGLGLDVVKRIVDRHKGRIEVQTEVGVGSTFSIFLPIGAAG